MNTLKQSEEHRYMLCALETECVSAFVFMSILIQSYLWLWGIKVKLADKQCHSNNLLTPISLFHIQTPNIFNNFISFSQTVDCICFYLSFFFFTIIYLFH